MRLTIALNRANVATAGEQDFASLSASRVDAAKAKIGRLQELIKKTKSAKNYKTSERLKASVERRTKLLKETQAKLKVLEKGDKAKPAKKAAPKKTDKKPKVLVNKNGKLSKSAKQPAGVRSAQKRKIANRGKTATKDHTGRTVRIHVKPKAGVAKKSPKRKPKLD